MIDAHVHLYPGDPQPLADRLAALGTARFNVLGVPGIWGSDNNLHCLRMKALYPGRAWVFGGLNWRGPECPLPERQLELMMLAGFDGLKLLETKPDMQKRLGFLPDASAFDAMFALAERRGIPIIWHVGDPAPFWHRDSAPAFAAENGWIYEGEGFLSLEELYFHTEQVLRRYPRLNAVFAHLYFCSDDRPHLERLLRDFPNVCIDLTPGSEMYHAFRDDREGWQDFFRRHAGRILLGSDATNGPDAFWSGLGSLPRCILRPRRFSIFDMEIRGFELDKAQYAAITAGNFTRLAGEAPKPIDPEGLKGLVDYYASQLAPQDARTIMTTYKEFFK